jgi:hypothetical protein
MFATLKKHGTTIVVAMVTAALTAATPAIAASVVDYARNAGKVDGKSAVGAAATPTKRAGKLVATDALGYLPDNILNSLDWTKLANVPAGFADGTDDVGGDWNSLTNVPAGFADGTDNVGYFKGTQVNQGSALGAGGSETWFTFGYPADKYIAWRVLPTTTGGKLKVDVSTELAGDGTVTYWLTVTNTGGVASTYSLIRYWYTD